MEVRQVDRMPVWQHYYDEDGKLIREVAFSEYKTMDGRLIPTRLVMRPVDKAGEQTVIMDGNVTFNAAISPDTVSLRNLEQ